MAASRRAFHGRVRKASTRTARAKKATNTRTGKRARVHGANVRRGF